jgi:hypothetical protein
MQLNAHPSSDLDFSQKAFERFIISSPGRIQHNQKTSSIVQCIFPEFWVTSLQIKTQSMGLGTRSLSLFSLSLLSYWNPNKGVIT